MKKGRNDKTNEFGADSEHYASQLYLMIRNPNGYRRPDLISQKGHFSPRLSMEVKSGRPGKGTLNATQLHYALTTAEDYREIMGEELPQRPVPYALLPGFELSEATPLLPSGQIAYYYCIIDRVDHTTSKDLDLLGESPSISIPLPWSTIKLRMGDQYIVPHDYGFYAFAVSRALRTGKNLEAIVTDLREIMRQQVVNAASLYEELYYDRDARQALRGKDVLAFWYKDPTKTTKQGIERVNAIRTAYPAIEKLERILIPGPNNTKIYVLADPADKDLFDQQLRQVVEQRTPAIERITRLRQWASEHILPKIAPAHTLFSGNGHSRHLTFTHRKRDYIGLKPSEIALMERLSLWLDKGEHELTAHGADEFNNLQESPPEEADTSFNFGANTDETSEQPVSYLSDLPF